MRENPCMKVIINNKDINSCQICIIICLMPFSKIEMCCGNILIIKANLVIRSQILRKKSGLAT